MFSQKTHKYTRVRGLAVVCVGVINVEVKSCLLTCLLTVFLCVLNVLLPHYTFLPVLLFWPLGSGPAHINSCWRWLSLR